MKVSLTAAADLNVDYRDIRTWVFRTQGGSVIGNLYESVLYCIIYFILFLFYYFNALNRLHSKLLLLIRSDFWSS